MLREARGAKGRAAWVVNVPPNLSPTGRRQELFFASKTEAKTECEKLKARKDNFGVSLTTMTAGRVAEAAECYKLLDLAADKRSLLEIVRAGLDLEQKRTASIPFGRLFQEYCDSRPAKTSAKHARSLRYTAERFAPLNDRLVCDIQPQEITEILKKRCAASVRLCCIVLARSFQPPRLPTSASHCNPTRFIQIPDFGRAIRGERSDSHLLGFIHVIGHEVQTDCRLYPSQGIVMRENSSHKNYCGWAHPGN